jgi:hypothetical protein
VADLFSIASGAARALWLAQLSDALDEAHELTCRLDDGSLDLELMDLHIRIEAARHEIRAMRLGRSDPIWAKADKTPSLRAENDPDWIGNSVWPFENGAV